MSKGDNTALSKQDLTSLRRNISKLTEIMSNLLKNETTSQELDPTSPFELNVGGSYFTTSIQTLLSIQGTYFEDMLSRKDNPPKLCRDGSLFIDRDASNFDIILNHLRGVNVGSKISKLNRAQKTQLLEDVRFYKLEESLDTYFSDIIMQRHLYKSLGQSFSIHVSFLQDSISNGEFQSYFNAFGVRWMLEVDPSYDMSSYCFYLSAVELYCYTIRVDLCVSSSKKDKSIQSVDFSKDKNCHLVYRHGEIDDALVVKVFLTLRSTCK
ncbi:hypothetical protein AKO1_007770 [Acrasis kona]|uniref:Potassium channel tetramerisation-type BTB domain-containing protein n=1 Tax=Acrasis kona TaxID=1008807 RepID=A0AAW2YTM2_9EUKA